METVKELLFSSVIMTGLLSLLLWGGTLYMVIQQIEVPDALWVADGLVTNFWFKAKVEARTP